MNRGALKCGLFLLVLSTWPLVARAWPFGNGGSRADERRLRSEIILEANRHLGEPYKWGASGPDAFDCSGFVHYVLKAALGAERFPLSYSLSTMKGYRNQSVYYRDQLRSRGASVACETAEAGDVVFFSPLRPKENNHIGIITDPVNRHFITAQGKGLGVAVHGYTDRSYWGQRGPECYRNVWVTAR